MRRRAVAFLTSLLILVAGASPAVAFSPAHRMRYCRYESSGNVPGWTEWKVRAELACAVTKFDVPGGFGTILAIVERESGLYAHAVNTSSGACGLGQHLPRYWPGRLAAFDRAHPRYRLSPSCFNARSNAMVTAWMMATSGLSPWRVIAKRASAP